jgi:predicted ATPase
MSKIRVKNFGPIKEGFSDSQGNDWIDIAKITVFIGNQGSGKSSVAKLISTMSWIEKALYRGQSEKDFTSYNRFIKTHCGYHNLKNYFRPNTEIEYEGKYAHIYYADSKLQIQKNEDTLFKSSQPYTVPKIMYVPAERNFLSSLKIKTLLSLKDLPRSLFTFWEELLRSYEEINKTVDLPIGSAKLEYDRLNKIPNIIGDGYELQLYEASSGFHSFVPLYVVSQNLAESIQGTKDVSRNELSSEQIRLIGKAIEQIYSNEDLPEEVKNILLKKVVSKYGNQCFFNIVEEIEQNLYPSSQKNVLYKLLEFCNMEKENKLLLTTHSPYIINYLSLAIQGGHLKHQLETSRSSDALYSELEKSVPLKACINSEDAIVYQLNEEGKIFKLSSFEGIPSDNNFLNQSLAEGNQLFDNLLEIEERI